MNELVETGVKAVDLYAPLPRGGRLAIRVDHAFAPSAGIRSSKSAVRYTPDSRTTGCSQAAASLTKRAGPAPWLLYENAAL